MISILIAEDDEILRGLYESWLPDILSGYEDVIVVSILPDGREVSSVLSRSRYDITILDMALPGMPGPDIYRKHSGKMGKVILASSYAEIFNTVLKSGDECLILNKPFGKEDLQYKIETAMEETGHANKGSNRSGKSYTAIE
jgi:DNA-binding NtrC family response regulator